MNPSELGQDPILTVKEAAHYLKVSEMTILRLANQGLICGAKVGRQWRFPREAVMRLVRHPGLLRQKENPQA